MNPGFSSSNGEKQTGHTQLTSMTEFEIMEQVGEGTYGRVYKARHLQSNQTYALKVILNNEEDEGLSFTAVREIKYLQQLSLAAAANVINLKGTFFSPAHELVLAFEYMPHDLSGLLSLPINFSEVHVKCLMRQLLTALHQCHSAGIMHRDVKAANLLLNHGTLKLADFGLATDYGKRPMFSTNVVTLWYRAPELLLGVTKYGPEVDVWSAGCIFLELLTRNSPFPGKDETHQRNLIFKACGTPTEETWEGVSQLPLARLLEGMPRNLPNRLRQIYSRLSPLALDLLEGLLALDPKKRITSTAAMNHDYFWTHPLPCEPNEVPCGAPLHEFQAKKQRQSQRLEGSNKRQRGASFPPSSHINSFASGQRTVLEPATIVSGRPIQMSGSMMLERRDGSDSRAPSRYSQHRSAHPPSQQNNPSYSVQQHQHQGQQYRTYHHDDAMRQHHHHHASQDQAERWHRAHEDRSMASVPPVAAVHSASYPHGDIRHHSASCSMQQVPNGRDVPSHSLARSQRAPEWLVSDSRTGKIEHKEARPHFEDSEPSRDEGEDDPVDYNRPPSDHSLETQPPLPTGAPTLPCKRSISPRSHLGSSSNRVLAAAQPGKRKRDEV